MKKRGIWLTVLKVQDHGSPEQPRPQYLLCHHRDAKRGPAMCREGQCMGWALFITTALKKFLLSASCDISIHPATRADPFLLGPPLDDSAASTWPHWRPSLQHMSLQGRTQTISPSCTCVVYFML